jgi:hypothetical protein
MFDTYSFGLAEADALTLAELHADAPGLAACVDAFVANDQVEEAAHAIC